MILRFISISEYSAKSKIVNVDKIVLEYCFHFIKELLVEMCDISKSLKVTYVSITDMIFSVRFWKMENLSLNLDICDTCA